MFIYIFSKEEERLAIELGAKKIAANFFNNKPCTAYWLEESCYDAKQFPNSFVSNKLYF